ncbi:hypothetical protein ACFSJI_30390 [Streptomyces calvus]|uniref:hypothetical protein n=1 Tax=Streptomyces calvus TaxID=67282 RepID=UPI0036281976
MALQQVSAGGPRQELVEEQLVLEAEARGRRVVRGGGETAQHRQPLLQMPAAGQLGLYGVLGSVLQFAHVRLAFVMAGHELRDVLEHPTQLGAAQQRRTGFPGHQLAFFPGHVLAE